MNPKTYKTVKQYGICEKEFKKSKFISQVFPITSEDEAQEILNRIRKEHPKAVHNVFAYSIGYKAEIIRQSDDGEPSGTSGMPTLEILTKEHITNTLIVTTRYFGGTLLGTGGLVQAYKTTAKEAVLSAKIIENELYTKLSIICEYTQQGKLQFEILNFDDKINMSDTVFTDKVTMIVYVPFDNTEAFIKKIRDITNDTASIVDDGTFYCTYYDDNFIVF